MESTRAKFKCHSVTNTSNGPGSEAEEAKLGPVYPDKDVPENKNFWKNTPSGQLIINITNPALKGFFVPYKDYYIDITPADPVE